ncbi:MAG: DUF4115 domain-containing protein [Anaerolineales bacterium]|nr:DUF4115 domain-containing protein [Anaerolineales bacterium]
MEDIGRLLRESREKLGLTLEEVERATRIRRRHLEALERGDPEALPSPVQARGFLRNYADYLGLDADEVLLRYAEKLQSRNQHPAVKDESRKADPSSGGVQVRTRRFPWLTSDLFIAAFVLIAVLAVVLWGGSQVLAAVQAEQTTESQAAGSLLTTASPAASPSATALPEGEQGQELPATAAPDAEVTLPPDLLGEEFSGEGVNLRLLIEKRAWLEVTVDGEQAFAGRVAPGEILEYQGQELVQVLTGNGRGIRVVYNGEDQGVLGGVGEVVSRLWTPQGQITPTPSATPSPTATPPQTDTPTPTPTPTDTPVP